MKKIGLKLVLAWVFAAPLQAQQNFEPLIDSIKEQLTENYLFPSIATKYADRLSQCQQVNCLSGQQSDEEVAKALSKMLNAVHKDRHLNVFPPGFESPIPQRKMVKKSGKKAVKADTGVKQSKILEGNIGYIEYTMFPGFEQAFEATQQAMDDMQEAGAIVFDIREHRGGHPKHVDIIAGYLFPEPTHLLTTRSPHNENGKPWKLISEPNEKSHLYNDKPVLHPNQ